MTASNQLWSASVLTVAGLAAVAALPAFPQETGLAGPAAPVVTTPDAATPTGIPSLPATLTPAPEPPARPTDTVPPEVVDIDPIAEPDVFPETVDPVSELQTVSPSTDPRVPVGRGAGNREARTSPPPGPQLLLDLGTGLRFDSDDGLALRNTLALTFVSQTREQLLELSVGAAVDVDSDGIKADNVFPDTRLAYARDTGVLLLSLSASYAESEITGRVPGLDFAIDDTDLIRDDGTRAFTNFDAGFEIGRRDPIGLRLDASYRQRTYRDTADPDLLDEDFLRYSGDLRFTLDPTLIFRLTGTVTDRQETGLGSVDDRPDDQKTTSLGGAVTWQATPITRLDLALAHTRIEDENARDDVDGIDGSLSLTRDRPNGTIGLAVDRSLTSNGDIYQFTGFREMELANGGALQATLGAGQFSDAGGFTIARLRYSQPLPQGQEVLLGLEREGVTDIDDQNVVRTRATLGYRRPVTPVSDLSLGLGLASFDVVEGFDADQSVIDLDVTYSHEIAAGWRVNLGYEGSVTREDGRADDRYDAVFLNVTKRFDLRF